MWVSYSCREDAVVREICFSAATEQNVEFEGARKGGMYVCQMRTAGVVDVVYVNILT